MEQSMQTKNSPYSVMDYNNLLMNMIHGISFNIGQGGTGIEQAHILRNTLKPVYQDDLKSFFNKLDVDFNTEVKVVEAQIKNSSLQSDRTHLNRKIMKIQRQYSLLMVREVIAVLDRHGALEFTQQITIGGQGFDKWAGIKRNNETQ